MNVKLSNHWAVKWAQPFKLHNRILKNVTIISQEVFIIICVCKTITRDDPIIA